MHSMPPYPQYKISCPRVNLSCISMIGVCVLLIIASTAAGDPAPAAFGGFRGYVGYSGHGYRRVSYSQPKKCTREVETITRKWCKLEYEKSCTTETKTFTKITGYEKGDCKEVEYCKRSYGKLSSHNTGITLSLFQVTLATMATVARGHLAMLLLSVRRRPRRSASRCLSRRRLAGM